MELEPDVEQLRKARLAMEVVAAVGVTPFVQTKLATLAPELSRGRWVTRGRMRKGLKPILGVSELAILMPEQRLAELVMLQAHEKNHDGPSGTLAQSRSTAWIYKARRLAQKVERRCVYCRTREARLVEQRMGQLPVERIAMQSPPFAGVCLDLMGPVVVKGVINKRANQKVWPLLFVCQATGALHICLMHNYGTEAFLLQYRSFVTLRGKPAKIVSDRGSQLTSSDNVVISQRSTLLTGAGK